MLPQTFLGKWTGQFAASLFHVVNVTVFLLLDLLDSILCLLYRVLDHLFEGRPSPCYCAVADHRSSNAAGGECGEGELSETLYGRDNIFKRMGFTVGFSGKRATGGCGEGGVPARWSDCGCESCVSWMSNGRQNLHVVVKEPSKAISEEGKPVENVIFLHGFLSSSSFWTETVFPNLSESGEANYRLFAVDLLGFGQSPKPRNCSYRLGDHLEMIEKSVIYPFQLNSFHVVAHSMGCIIALALASKYKTSVRSITLTAPPYFPCREGDASLAALRRIAEKRVWPPLQFGAAVMSWYEHLGRCVCLLFCRNHRTWERILKLLTRTRELPLLAMDLTRHTHHSAWHTMHNVICGGAKLMDKYMETAANSGVKICVVHGDRDQVVPLECSINMKTKIPDAEINIIPNTDHNTVILERKQAFTRYLELVWTLASGVKTENS